MNTDFHAQSRTIREIRDNLCRPWLNVEDVYTFPDLKYSSFLQAGVL
jgi:hypothetical protein